MRHCHASLLTTFATASVVASLAACAGGDGPDPLEFDHGPIAEDVSAPLGEIVPYATEEQRETFERGRLVAERRFELADGLGPAFNVVSCRNCHERPVLGGGGARYRNFFLCGVRTDEGAFLPATSAGPSGGVVRMYGYKDVQARPPVDERINVIAQRNPIPFFGVGLLAELGEDEILKRADPDDLDGDGISGRPNYDQGFVGRFGRKAQTVSIEGFIRGPLFNHLGVTSNPLTEEQRARLPVDSSGGEEQDALFLELGAALSRFAQAAAPSAPLTDDDGVPDPELSNEDLFDLVSFSMLLAAPEVEPIGRGQAGHDQHWGLLTFDEIGCAACHTPRLVGPRGPLPVYSDLLLHDMGEELADGLEQGEAEGNEFRTQPLWGISAAGPFLHDGRADTMDDAIRLHGGEATAAREAYEDLDDDRRAAVLVFLESLGGRSQVTEGLLPQVDDIPAVGDYGGPARTLNDEDAAAFAEGRRMFDRDQGLNRGLGGPRFNGDSCRACHFDPVIGGSGPRDVNVMRHGLFNGDGDFVVPAVGTILHKITTLPDSVNAPQETATLFEHRQTPHVFGLGLVESIPDEVIEALADPFDLESPDGITGKVSIVDGGRVGRFGWKAQVPTIREFVRDAVTAELGMTLPADEGQTYGLLHDDDDVADPELTTDEARQLETFLALLAPPPRQLADDVAAAERGEELFETVGCAACHVPVLEGADGPVPLYSDLLLHDVLAAEDLSVEDASATTTELRTPPLWGLSQTGPYMHDGAADTIEASILLHSGEGDESREAFEMLDDSERADLLIFLGTL